MLLLADGTGDSMCLSWGVAGTHRRDLGAWILTGTTLGGKEEPNRGFKALMKPLISIRSDSALL